MSEIRYVVEGNYNDYGWEIVTYEESKVDAIKMTQDYRANTEGAIFRYRVARESER